MLDGHLCEYARSALAVSGLPAAALVLEITERTLMVNSYSSLAYLRSFPIDIVKIDQTFVASLDEDEQAVALVRSIISITEALGLDVVAEGVKTPTQLKTLRRLGCQVTQGHYYSPALSVEALAAYLEEREVLPSYE
jgi:EAL domain-containing protein (putative c-di-GMP-specific phosphodiesterase class I)